jgi:hypothetical protein
MKSSKKRQPKPSKKRPMNRLERDTAAYWENMSDEELEEDQELGRLLSQMSKGIDFDKEE